MMGYSFGSMMGGGSIGWIVGLLVLGNLVLLAIWLMKQILKK